MTLTPQQQEAYKKAADLIRNWMEQDIDHDEVVWKILEEALNEIEMAQGK